MKNISPDRIKLALKKTPPGKPVDIATEAKWKGDGRGSIQHIPKDGIKRLNPLKFKNK